MEDKLGNVATILPEPGEVEVWRQCIEFPDYFVSSFGNIRKNEMMLHPSTDKYGYQYINIYPKKYHKFRYIHRLVCEAFYGKEEDKNICDHIDFCRCNNYYKNLRWVNPSESSRHRQKRAPEISRTKIPIVLVDSETHKFKQRFNSIQEAHEKTGLSEAHIARNVVGQRKDYKCGRFMTEEAWKAEREAS